MHTSVMAAHESFSFMSSYGKSTCWPRYKIWLLDDKITSYNLDFKGDLPRRSYSGHIIEVEKLYHTHVNKVTKIIYSV